ncbi:unnamed protein product [Somion occarium]|uniref:Uncharacterized protein n=1 Tax=Somion occarium TaxID=3059160 RepID=A0ABP1DRP6_9APHY
MASSTTKRTRALTDTSEAPPSKQQRPIDRLLRYTVLNLTHDQHAAYDKAAVNTNALPSTTVIDALKDAPKALVDSLAQAIISVCRTCPDYMKQDLSKQEVVEWLTESTALRETVVDAFRKQSFKAIRDLAIFQSETAGAVPRSTAQRLQVDLSTYEKVIQSAWEISYVGSHPELFVYNLNHSTRNPNSHYCNSVSIVQSSGSGKSRMVREASGLVFTIPCNLRPPQESAVNAYPPSDKVVFDHLSMGSSTEQQVLHRFLNYFTSLFKEVTRRVEMLMPNERPTTYEELTLRWRQHLERGNGAERKSMYESVISEAKALDVKKNKDMLNNMMQALRGLLRIVISLRYSKRGSWSKIESEDVKLLLCFDESQTLAKQRVLGADGKPVCEKNYYHIFLSCLNEWLQDVNGTQVMAVFLSTNSDIYDLAPLPEHVPSARYMNSRSNLQPPLNETPFDCSPDLPLGTDELNKLTLAKASQISFLARFGRPLWWSFIRGGYQANDYGALAIEEALITIARCKLLSVGDQALLTESPSTFKRHAVSAILDVLIKLDYESSRESFERELELVASNMRLIYSVPQSRYHIRTGYSSEPILAEAAAQQMYQFMCLEGGEGVMSTILEQNFEFGSTSLIDDGQRGEVVARLLIMTAYIRAVAREQSDETKVFFSRGCKLITFIEELYPEHEAEALLDSVPSNLTSKKKFRDVFKKSIIRLTHFVRAGDDSATTVPAMKAAFIRCMGFICSWTQNTVDFMIAILIDEDLPITDSNITAMMWQIKRRRDKGAINTYDIRQDKINFFPKDPQDETPYITIVAELGVQPPRPRHLRTAVKVTERARLLVAKGQQPAERPAPPSKQKPLATPSHMRVISQGTTKHPRDKHPKYSVFVYGCSPTIYKVISEEERNRFHKLLALKDFLDEHPRQHIESLKAVRKLKPVWYLGIEFYHWLLDPFLQNRRIPESEDNKQSREDEYNEQSKEDEYTTQPCFAVGTAADYAIEHFEDQDFDEIPSSIPEETELAEGSTDVFGPVEPPHARAP